MACLGKEKEGDMAGAQSVVGDVQVKGEEREVRKIRQEYAHRIIDIFIVQSRTPRSMKTHVGTLQVRAGTISGKLGSVPASRTSEFVNCNGRS